MHVDIPKYFSKAVQHKNIDQEDEVMQKQSKEVADLFRPEANDRHGEDSPCKRVVAVEEAKAHIR